MEKQSKVIIRKILTSTLSLQYSALIINVQLLMIIIMKYEQRKANITMFWILSFFPIFILSDITFQYAPVREVIAFINHYFFHGVQHFVFNINGQLDYWKKALKKYNDHGIIDIVDFTFPNKKPFHEQQVVMNSCNRRYRYATQFMIQCDVDEFFLPLNPRWRIIDVVRLYDLAYPNMDAFSVDICFDY